MAIADSIYQRLTNDEDATPCAEIGAEACRETPTSFSLILLSSFLTKLGDALASPKTTLAWVAGVIGAPPAVLGFLVPIRESGSLIPQLFIGGIVRGLPVRKWVWVTGACIQCLAIVAIGITVAFARGALAGALLLGCVVLFSLARGFCSVASKDVLGKTIPETKRGQLTGWATASAGLVALLSGLGLSFARGATPEFYALLILCAGLLWLVAAAVYANIPEHSGETGSERSAMASLRRLRLLVNDRPFGMFVAARALLMCSALSAPFYVALAQQSFDATAATLGMFVASGGLAALVSGPVWGRFADRSSRLVMAAAGVLTAATGMVTFALEASSASVTESIWFLPCAYLLLSVAHSGVRVGRKTHVVNIAVGNRRTDYVAISNTVIGVLLLVFGALGALTPWLSLAGIIGLLATLGLAGAALSLSLPEAGKPAGD